MSRSSDTASRKMPRVLGVPALVTLGVAGIIGTGIFVMTGIAAHDLAGPAVIVSFGIAGVACACAALCYADLSARFPVAGSAYRYATETLGRFGGWLVGWCLFLEYVLASASVAQGWSHYVQDFAGSFGLRLSPALSGRMIDLPALLIVALFTLLLVRGIRPSVRASSVFVVIKIAAILLVIGVGVFYVRPENWTPFAPHGWGAPTGVLAGAAMAFYAYMGFQALAAYSEEARVPRKDVPKGILLSVAVCAVLYMAVAAVLTGMVPASQISVKAPVSDAFRQVGLPWVQQLVALGALAGITSVLLIILMTLPRILLAMGRDALLPPQVFGVVHPRWGTPWAATLTNGILVALLAAFVPLRLLADVVVFTTLCGFIVVGVVALIARRGRSGAAAGLALPPMVGALCPIAGIAVCLGLLAALPVKTALYVLAWLALGAAVYAAYGRRAALESKTANAAAAPPMPEPQEAAA